MLERSYMEIAGGDAAVAREAEQALHFKNRARGMLDGGLDLSEAAAFRWRRQGRRG